MIECIVAIWGWYLSVCWLLQRYKGDKSVHSIAVHHSGIGHESVILFECNGGFAKFQDEPPKVELKNQTERTTKMLIKWPSRGQWLGWRWGWLSSRLRCWRRGKRRGWLSIERVIHAGFNANVDLWFVRQRGLRRRSSSGQAEVRG